MLLLMLVKYSSLLLSICSRGHARAFIKDAEKIRSTAIIGLCLPIMMFTQKISKRITSDLVTITISNSIISVLDS